MKKMEFRDAVAEVVLTAAVKAILKNMGKGATYKITMKNGSCYVVLHRYEEDLQILLFRNGNITLRFKEFCHGEQNIAYYEYDETDDHEALLKTAKKDLKILISDFISKKMDCHIFLDYLTDSRPGHEAPPISLKRDDDAWIDWYKSMPFGI